MQLQETWIIRFVAPMIALGVMAGGGWLAWGQAPALRNPQLDIRTLAAAKNTSEPLGSARQARISLCQTSLIWDVEVPAPESGVIVSMEVSEGNTVREESLMARVDDRQALIQKMAAELERDAAMARAEDDIEVRYAEASNLKAQAEFDDVRAIEKRAPGSIPVTKVREMQLEVQRSKLQIDRSKLDLRVAKMTSEIQQAKVRMADDAIARRRILSPINGEVLTVHRQKGEWVNAGEAVVRVAQLERLRVEGFLSAADYTPGDIGHRPVVVEVVLSQGRTAQFTGAITFVSPQIQAGNKFRVRAEVENRKEDGNWLLQSGKEATMTIQLQ